MQESFSFIYFFLSSLYFLEFFIFSKLFIIGSEARVRTQEGRTVVNESNMTYTSLVQEEAYKQE